MPITPLPAPDHHDPYDPYDPYDPWVVLAHDWPQVRVVVEPMAGPLLGELRYPVIALRAGTSAAQQRCTLTHELVHLERALDCTHVPGLLQAREERAVHAEAARRLLPLAALHRAARALGDVTEGADPATETLIAAQLDVDLDTLHTRMAGLTTAERHALDTACRAASDPLSTSGAMPD